MNGGPKTTLHSPLPFTPFYPSAAYSYTTPSAVAGGLRARASERERERATGTIFFSATQKRPPLQLTCDSATLARKGDLRKYRTLTGRERARSTSSSTTCRAFARRCDEHHTELICIVCAEKHMSPSTVRLYRIKNSRDTTVAFTADETMTMIARIGDVKYSLLWNAILSYGTSTPRIGALARNRVIFGRRA